MLSILADGTERLPEAFEFLNMGWWILHLVAIPTVFVVGYLTGKRGRAKGVTTTRVQP